jgi:hypothetical protein
LTSEPIRDKINVGGAVAPTDGATAPVYLENYIGGDRYEDSMGRVRYGVCR